MDVNSDRQYLPPLAELVDRLCINHIKEIFLSDDRESFRDENRKLAHDVDLILQEKKICVNARMLRIIIVLAQMNLHIWHNKDEMMKDSEQYDSLLKLAHQLNGIRNQAKNQLLEEVGDKEKSAVRTNYNTDGLQGWNVSFD